MPSERNSAPAFPGASQTGELEELQCALGYRFERTEHLARALTHSSWRHEFDQEQPDNETYEFFGDAILEMVVTEALFRGFPNFKEGRLSKLRAQLVKSSSLAKHAKKIGLGPYLRLGRGEEKGGGRHKRSLLADAFEAVVAAVYLDGGMAAARQFVLATMGPALQDASEAARISDAKSALQSLAHRFLGSTPTYEVIGEEGPDHDKRFSVQVEIDGNYRFEGRGRSKKRAEQEAAQRCLTCLQEIARTSLDADEEPEP